MFSLAKSILMAPKYIYFFTHIVKYRLLFVSDWFLRYNLYFCVMALTLNTIIKAVTRHLLAATVLIAAVSCSGKGQMITVTAPESPYGFEPLQMFCFPDKDFNITTFGATSGPAEGMTDSELAKANSDAFSKAMEACCNAGGGRVVVPSGSWICGPVHFRSNCNLYLSEGAEVIFVDNPDLYLPAVHGSWEGAECMTLSSLVYAYECENIAISGPGKLCPRMDFWRGWFDRTDQHLEATRQLYTMLSTGVPVEERHMEGLDVRMRPQLILLNRCTNVQLDGFKVRESPFWTIHLFMCKDVWAHDLDIYAHGHNNDGIDLEMTQHVIVEDCTFDQGDDGVVIKAGRNHDGWRLATPSSDIVVRNCNIINGHTVLGIGSEMSGGVERVYMHDCSSSNEVYRLFYIKTNHRRGGFIRDITVENVSATSMMRVFEINTDVLYQWRDIVPTYETRITDIHGITVKNCSAVDADAIYEISGDERKPVDGIVLENIRVERIHEFESRTENVQNLTEKNVTYGSLVKTPRQMFVPGIAPGK